MRPQPELLGPWLTDIDIFFVKLFVYPELANHCMAWFTNDIYGYCFRNMFFFYMADVYQITKYVIQNGVVVDNVRINIVQFGDETRCCHYFHNVICTYMRNSVIVQAEAEKVKKGSTLLIMTPPRLGALDSIVIRDQLAQPCTG